MLTTTSAQAADKLAGQVNTVVLHRMTDPVLAESFARITGDRLVPSDAARPQPPGRGTTARDPATATGTVVAGAPAAKVPGDAGMTAATAAPADAAAFLRRPVVSPERLSGLGNGEFVLVVKTPQRLVPLGKTVRGRLASPYRNRHRRPVHAAPGKAVSRQAMPGVAAEESAPPRQPFGIDSGPAIRGGDPAGNHLGSPREPGMVDWPQPGVPDGHRPAPAGPRGQAIPNDPRLARLIPRQSAEQRRWPT